MYIATKIMVFLLILSILAVVREVFNFLVSWVSNGHYEPEKKRVLIFALALSYIFTIIFTGFKLF